MEGYFIKFLDSCCPFEERKIFIVAENFEDAENKLKGLFEEKFKHNNSELDYFKWIDMDSDATVNYEHDSELSIFEKMENGYKARHNYKIICEYVENVI
ncbi:MAG: hypothetical protein CL760_11755 [Chloroflexi bacterium]|nr:hypothetical protein [Chloroflexota bacterium]|tara:strand:+ start:77898 stop:78194 length:297 start_codon:yes stop_codon:yes gene_type:complete